MGVEIEISDEIAEEFGVKLAAAVQEWFSGSDRTLSTWRRMMRDELASPMEEWLLGPYSASLVSRGITPLGDEQARVYVVRALKDTDDLRERLLNAPSVGSLTASPWFVETLLHPLHQSKIVSSLFRRVQDLFSFGSVEREPDFTGRRRWRIAASPSRHTALDFVVKGPDGLFNVGGNLWVGPRGDITNAPEASGCTCYLEWETVAGDWV